MLAVDAEMKTFIFEGRESVDTDAIVVRHRHLFKKRGDLRFEIIEIEAGQ